MPRLDNLAILNAKLQQKIGIRMLFNNFKTNNTPLCQKT